MNSYDASSLPTLDLLAHLGREMTEVFDQTLVVGKWVWLEFNVAPVKSIRDKLRQLGFHWNAGRKCWQPVRGARSPLRGRSPVVLSGHARRRHGVE